MIDVPKAAASTARTWRSICSTHSVTVSFLISLLSSARFESANRFSRLSFSLSFAQELITVNRLHCSITRRLKRAEERRRIGHGARAKSVFMLKIMAARVTAFGNISPLRSEGSQFRRRCARLDWPFTDRRRVLERISSRAWIDTYAHVRYCRNNLH